MRILIITRYFPPYPSIASQRPWSWAKSWVELGHTVSVLTWDGKEDSRYHVKTKAGDIEIINVVNRVYAFFERFISGILTPSQPMKSATVDKNINSIVNQFVQWVAKRQHDCRVPHIHDFWKKDALHAIRGESWDLVISTYAPPVTHAIGYALKKAGATRFWIADYRDLWLEHTIAPGIFPFTLWEQVLEKRYSHNADLMTTVSEPLARALSCKYPHALVEAFTNGFDREELDALLSDSFFSDPKVRLVYTGSLYPGKRDPSPLFEAVSRLKSDVFYKLQLEDLELVFAGSSKDYVEKAAEEYDVSQWVSHIGTVSREDALRMQRDAHVLIFLEWGDCELDGVLTGKLFEYMCSGTEIWALGIKPNSAAGQLITDTRSGVVLGNNVDAIVKLLKQLITSRQKNKVTIDPKILKRFDRKLIAERLIALASNIIDCSPDESK